MSFFNFCCYFIISLIFLANPVAHANFKTTNKNYQRSASALTKASLKKPKFDLPIEYNKRVNHWVKIFKNRGKGWFTKWLNRSNRYTYTMRKILKKRGLPQDLFYISMIESGFSAYAHSSASAVGYWQFIKPTANQYGLKTHWWIDERKDFIKSTTAASKYLKYLNRIFGNWYLAASAYNMGENRLKRLIRKHKSRNYWVLSSKRDFPKETRDYIPKLIAAIIIAKSPRLHGFTNLKPHKPLSYEYFFVPGGTDLLSVANHLNLTKKQLKKLNPSILRGYIPNFVKNYPIRIPRGSSSLMNTYVNN